jgi:hypothetical protein
MSANKNPSIHPPAPPYIGPERRIEMQGWRAHIEQRLDDGSTTMKALRAELEANTKATKEVEANTGELVELMKSFKGAFAVFDLIGRVAKPLGAITAMVAAVWSLVSIVKGGK